MWRRKYRVRLTYPVPGPRLHSQHRAYAGTVTASMVTTISRLVPLAAMKPTIDSDTAAAPNITAAAAAQVQAQVPAARYHSPPVLRRCQGDKVVYGYHDQHAYAV